MFQAAGIITFPLLDALILVSYFGISLALESTSLSLESTAGTVAGGSAAVVAGAGTLVSVFTESMTLLPSTTGRLPAM